MKSEIGEANAKRSSLRRNDPNSFQKSRAHHYRCGLWKSFQHAFQKKKAPICLSLGFEQPLETQGIAFELMHKTGKLDKGKCY